jgi:hypothetical protein
MRLPLLALSDRYCAATECLLAGVSGYTILAIAVACAAVLELPSPLLGIDLRPVRTGIYGASIAAVGILAACLVTAKLLRAAQEALSTRFVKGRGRFVFVVSRTMSFWQGNESPNGPVLQIHLQGILTNPNMSSGLIVSRVELFRLTPFGIFSKQECLNFALAKDLAGLHTLHTVRRRHSDLMRVDHFHPGQYPQTQKHIWVCLQIVDQRNRRSRKVIRLRHVRMT